MHFSSLLLVVLFIRVLIKVYMLACVRVDGRVSIELLNGENMKCY